MKRIKLIMPFVAIFLAVVATYAAHETSTKDTLVITPEYENAAEDCLPCSSGNIVPAGSTCTYTITSTLCKCRIGGVDRQLFGIGDGVTMECLQPLYKQ